MIGYFYLFALLPIVHYLIMIVFHNKMRVYYMTMYNSYDKGEVVKLSWVQKLIVVYNIWYFLWLIVGLFTAQWYLFVVLILLSLIGKKIGHVILFSMIYILLLSLILYMNYIL